MKIGIDATILRNDRITGVERYIIELIRGFKNIEHNYEIYVLLNKAYTKFDKQIGYGIPIYSPVNNRIYNDQIWIPYITRKLKLSMVHFPVFGAPLLYRGKFVMTIHDLTFWLYPTTISKGAKYYYKPLFLQSVKRASHIITVSDSSKQGVKEIFKISEKGITITYEALSTDFIKARGESIDNSSQITEFTKHSYILSVGTIEPRKNLETLINALAILKNTHNLPHKFVLTGRTGWQKKLNIPENIKSDIIRTGYVNDAELFYLYKNAALYVFPSLYEGFGFPLLEALYTGIPVVASNSSSLPEIGGDVCTYVNNPLSAQEFADKILETLQQPDSSEQRCKRQNRANAFSWEQCAGDTIKVYDAVLNP